MGLYSFLLLVIGFVLLIGGAEMFVRGAARLAMDVGISPLVVGLTVVAYGTSAPEVAVSLQSVFAKPPQVDIAVGNVVGSNISNVLLVLGLSATVAPLVIAPAVVRSSVPLMIAVSVAVGVLGYNGTIGRLEGLALFAGAIAYTVAALLRSHREVRQRKLESGVTTRPPPRRDVLRSVAGQLALITVGLAVLLYGAKSLVDGAVQMATMLGVSELVIGLTVVAVGTSLPEIATSLVAGLRGQREIAVGNVVGSNIFNILLVLGLCATVAPQNVVVSQTARQLDIPVMIVVAAICLPVFMRGYVITRWEGGIFLAYYAAYTVYRYLYDIGHEMRDHVGWTVLAFSVVPALIIVVVLGVRRRLARGATAARPDLDNDQPSE